MKAGALVAAARPAVDLRRDPSARSELVTQLRLGDCARVLGMRRRAGRTWLRVAGLHDRYPGWADAALLAPVAPRRRGLSPAIRRSLVHHALAFRGVRYLWGGTTPAGFDCSGFVQFLYRLHGIHLPRDAWMQAADRRMHPVRRSVLRASDLLFFAPPDRPRARITHVGMAVSRDRFVHATTSGPRPVVQDSRVSAPAWTTRRVAIRRIF